MKLTLLVSDHIVREKIVNRVVVAVEDVLENHVLEAIVIGESISSKIVANNENMNVVAEDVVL